MTNSTANCCRKPDIHNGDFMNYDWETGAASPRVNRVCLHCFAHWYGTPDAVKAYTRQEWDAWLQDSIQDKQTHPEPITAQQGVLL